MGRGYLLLCLCGGWTLPLWHCSQPRQRLPSSSDPYTLTSVPWDVTEGVRSHGALVVRDVKHATPDSAHQLPKIPACPTRLVLQGSSSAIRCFLRGELPQSCWEMSDRKTWEYLPSQYSSRRRRFSLPNTLALFILCICSLFSLGCPSPFLPNKHYSFFQTQPK